MMKMILKPHLFIAAASVIAGIFYLMPITRTSLQIIDYKNAHHQASNITQRILSDPTTSAQIQVLKSPSAPLSPSLIHIEIPSPKNPRKFQYSVILQSPNNYSGVASLITEPQGTTRPYPPLTFEWAPIVEGEYEILVHEVSTRIMEGNLVEILPIHRASVTVERQSSDGASIQDRLDSHHYPPPCYSLNRTDVYSTWDGDWIGPGLGLEGKGDTLRNGWRFVPSHQSMNCTIPTYSQKDLLSVQEEKSIFVFGTSRERGVFLSLLDLLLSPSEKDMLDVSVIGKCWGRATVQKGNIKLLYQDFRVIHFEPPGATRTMECHNDKIAKLGDALFIENAWKVWGELFEVEREWPDVVYMLTNDGPNYDFEYHTMSFISKLPTSWNGTLVFSDFSFTAKRPNMEFVEKHNAYRLDLKEKLDMLNDSRIRWLDGMGISKEMRLYGEWGENHIAQSQHFHHFCNDTFVDSDGTTNTMNVCSNITEMVAQLLLGHALGPKETLQLKQSIAGGSNIDTSLRYCHSCPRRLLPFHITPNPDMTCEMGPFHERTDMEELAVVCSKSSDSESDACPDSCMKEDVSYQFDSQTDVVNVRECSILTGNAVKDETDIVVKPAAESVFDRDNSAIPSWLHSNLADSMLGEECNEADKPFYWNIPESGGTTIQNLYMCIGLTIANELGGVPTFPFNNETKLIKFLPFYGREWSVVNVDTSTTEGILRAKTVGLTYSNNPSVDVVVSPHLRLAAKELFDLHHRGRVFAIFRHPVHRVLSRHHAGDSIDIDNWIVRNLVGKDDPNISLTDEDLKLAKNIVRAKIFVGLESKFVKSFDRFNEYLGIKIHRRWTRGHCIREYVQKKNVGIQDVNASIDQVKATAERNSFDVALYEYVEGLFNEQEMMLTSGADGFS